MSKSKLLIYLSIFSVLIVIVLLGFRFFQLNVETNLNSLDPNLYDQSWFTGNPCSGPCWYGIIPGKSSRNDVVSIIKKLPFIDTSVVEIPAQGASFRCKKPKYDNQDCVTVSFDNEILDYIWLTPNYLITFEQATKKLGTPDGFSAHPVDSGATRCYLGIIWKEKQLVLEHIADRPFWGDDLCEQILHNGGKIPNNLLVENVVISLPNHLQSLMNFKPWKGFAGK